MLLGPTVFPLAFAALGGRSLKNIALWRAERGSTLGVSGESVSGNVCLLNCDRILRAFMEARASSAPLVLPFLFDRSAFCR
ncbi:hypothetical protein C7974DRAFT_112820 [Boeremia exigua]|uniref:uncharacterized protein n=1 Tax=Boeremia exigua TaxID=749465 RepID=UPI001E8DFB03|nr:uncharacterized protein C7974DRAFT_112820 [Boeremia exigua]KAH6642924.1 hypothetical protein C7974DRAFT_112820 [Boeremia exigua]